MADKMREIEISLLKNRAHRLATPIETSDDNAETERHLIFTAMESKFSVPLDFVEAVTKISDIMPIPHTPAHIQGVIRRRGQTIALVNLRYFFTASTESLADEDYAVVLKVKGKLFALQVEDVEGVSLLPTASIFPVPESYDKALRPYISGITMDDLAIINLNEILMTPNFSTTPIEG
ncbi:MAG: chemotaxis protein CheW [Deltaproteobacteria bacterium]|nr:chemotaxis protein CheW [Deltaproteobacteria bacterium]